MIENNYFTDNADLVTFFNELVDWPEIVQAAEGSDFREAERYRATQDEAFALAPGSVEEAVEFYRSSLESAGEVSGGFISQRAHAMDRTGLKFESGTVTVPPEAIECFEKLREAGLVPYKTSRLSGGLGLPAVMHALLGEILARADVSFAMTIGLLNVAEVLNRYGTPEQRETFARRMTGGEYMGAMALTEPNYGSDLRNIGTRAVKQPDGTFLLTGTKRFISQGCGLGDRPAIILTLARTGGPGSGARGLSMFIVRSTDVEIAGIEEKMGIHASPTCEVVYENSPGLLIGEEGFGLTRYAMSMMNDARISVAALGVGIATAAYFEASRYASQREQFGRTIDSIPGVRRMLDQMEREIAAMRLLACEGARAIDRFLHPAVRLEEDGMAEREIRKDEGLRHWERLAALLTPLAKYYSSEMSCVCASLGVQVHGGAGYTEEYDAARIYRDSRITTVYEGTTQLQVVATIGGITAGLAPSGFLRKYLADEMNSFPASADLTRLIEMLEEAVRVYKSVDESSIKDGIAFEVMEIAARVINSMLLERSLQRLSAPNKDRHARFSREYNIDSLAICQGNLIRLVARSVRRAPASV